MVVYEVNLKVNKAIAAEFQDWLAIHVDEMLAIKGFEKAQCLLEEKTDEPDKVYWTTQYYLTDRASLQDYFDNHAAVMRQDGIDRFGDQFSAERRIFSVVA